MAQYNRDQYLFAQKMTSKYSVPAYRAMLQPEQRDKLQKMQNYLNTYQQNFEAEERQMAFNTLPLDERTGQGLPQPRRERIESFSQMPLDERTGETLPERPLEKKPGVFQQMVDVFRKKPEPAAGPTVDLADPQSEEDEQLQDYIAQREYAVHRISPAKAYEMMQLKPMYNPNDYLKMLDLEEEKYYQKKYQQMDDTARNAFAEEWGIPAEKVFSEYAPIKGPVSVPEDYTGRAGFEPVMDAATPTLRAEAEERKQRIADTTIMLDALAAPFAELPVKKIEGLVDVTNAALSKITGINVPDDRGGALAEVRKVLDEVGGAAAEKYTTAAKVGGAGAGLAEFIVDLAVLKGATGITSTPVLFAMNSMVNNAPEVVTGQISREDYLKSIGVSGLTGLMFNATTAAARSIGAEKAIAGKLVKWMPESMSVGEAAALSGKLGRVLGAPIPAAGAAAAGAGSQVMQNVLNHEDDILKGVPESATQLALYSFITSVAPMVVGPNRIRGAELKTGMKAAQKMFDETLFRQQVIDHKVPDHVILSARQLRDIWQTGKLTTAEEKSLVQELMGKNDATIKDLIRSKHGLDIEIGAGKIVRLVDKPYWSKIKGIFRLDPYMKTVKRTTGEMKAYRTSYGKRLGEQLNEAEQAILAGDTAAAQRTMGLIDANRKTILKNAEGDAPVIKKRIAAIETQLAGGAVETQEPLEVPAQPTKTEIREQAEDTTKPKVKSRKPKAKSKKPKAERKKQKTYVRTSKGVFEVERETDKSWILTNGTIARKSAKGNSISTEMAYKRSLARRKAPSKRKVTDEVNLRTSNITPERTPFLDHFKSTGMQTSDVDLKNYRIGIKPLFSKDGVELDRVMETLSDDHPLWAMTQGDTEAYKQGLLDEIDKLYNLGDGRWDEVEMEQQEALAHQRQAEEEAAQLLKKAEKIPAMDLNLNDKVKWVDPETGLVHEGVVVDEMPWSKVIQNNVTMELDDFESLYVLDVQKATPAEVAEKKEEFEESTQPTEEQLEHGVIPELDNQMAQFGRRANEKAEQGELFGETETPEKGKPRQLPKDELKKLEEKKLAAIQTGGKTGDEIKALQAKARDEARRELEEKYYGREIDFGEGVTDTQKITEKPAPGLAPQQPDIEKQAGVNHDNVIVHDIETINEISDRLSVLENIIGRGKSWTELTTQQRKALIKEQKDLEYKLNDMKSPQDKITQVEHGTAYIELDKEIGWAMGDYGKEDKIFVLRFTDKPETDILRKTSVHNIGDVDWNDLPDFIQENYSEEDVINTETGERAIIQKGLNGFPLEAKRLKDAIEEANNVILSTSGGNTLRTYANKKEGKKEYNLMNMKNAYIFEGVNLEFDDVPDGIVFYPHRIAFSSLESPRIKKVSVVTKQIKDEHIDNAHETVDTSTQEPPAPVVFTEGQRKVLKAYGALSAPEAEQLEVLKIDGAIKLLNQRMNQAEENSDIDQMSAIAKQLRAEERKMKRLKKNYGDTNKERYAIDVDELIQEMNEIQDLLIGESDPGKLAELRDRATIVKEMIDEYQGVEKPKVRKQSTPRTKTGGSMLKKIQRDQKGNAIGIRSIVEFVDKNLPVHTYWRKEQTSRKYPAHYNKRGGFIRSRAINSQIVFHEQGHAMYQRIIEHDNGFARKYGKALKDVARMDMSMASANNAHEGFAEWLRRYIVAPETIQGLSITPKIEAYLTERYPQAKKVFDDAGLMMDAHKSRSKAAQFRSASSDLPQQKIFEHIREKAGMLGVTIARGYGVEHFDRKIVNEIIKEARTRAEGIRQARKWRRETLDAVDPKASYQQIVRIPAEVNDVFYGTEHGRNGVKVIGEDGNYRYLYDKSFREIFEMVGNDRWDDFQDYVWAKVSKERWDVKRVRYPGILDGIKPKDLGEIAASYEEDSPDFPVLLNEMNRYFDALLDVAQLSGEFSEDAVQAMKDTYDVYAPMLRETPDGIRTITGSRTTPSSGIKGVRGGSLNPYKNLLESAEKRTRDVLGGYYWNKLIGDLYKVGRETSSDETLPYDVRKMAGEMITELHLDTTVPVHLTEAEQRQIIADYLNEKEAEQVPDGMMTLDKLEADDIDFAPGHMPIFRKKAPNAVYVVAPTIPNKGRVYLQINDPVLFSVFAESKEPAKVFKLMDKLFGPVVAAWKPGITGTIPFALINGLARDIANASFMGTGLKGAIPYYYFLKGAAGRITGKSKDIRKSSELLVKSLESAGSDAQKMRRDKFMEELRKGIVLPEWKRLDFTDKMLSIPGIAMHAALKPLHLFLYGTGQIQLSEFLESLPREGAAMQEKEKGGSDQRVSMAYDTITGNFAEHSGSADVRAIMHTLGFVQAGLNISYRQFLKLTDPLDWKKNLMRLAWSGVGITAITWALKELLSTEQDNERENERPEEDRFAYMDIKGLRIPFDYGMIGGLQTFTWNVLDSTVGGKSLARRKLFAKAIAKRVLDAPGPTALMAPQVKAWIEMKANYSFYFDKEIEPWWMQNLPEEERRYAATPEIYSKVGKLAKMSPLKLKYLVDQGFNRQYSYAFGLAQRAKRGTLDAEYLLREPADIPFIGRLFIREPLGWGSESVKVVSEAANDAAKAEEQMQQELASLVQQYGEGWKDTEAGRAVTLQYITLKKMKEAQQTIDAIYKKIKEEEKKEKPDWGKVYASRQAMTRTAQEALMATKLLEEK
jgi:hypothetical protein